MNNTLGNSDELKRLETAKELFTELLKDCHAESDVRSQLKNDLAECESRIQSLQTVINKKIKRPKRHEKRSRAKLLKMDKNYFIKEYMIDFHPGLQGKRGKFIFDNKINVPLSEIENAICLLLFNKLKRDWDKVSPVKDIGWVDYDEIINSVHRWKQKIKDDPNFVVTGSRINTVIDRINRKIYDKLGAAFTYDLIENIEPYGEESKKYRLIVNSGHIDLLD